MKNAGEIYIKYRDEITNFCCALLNNYNDGCDCTHEVFLTLMQKLPNMTEGNIRSWLYTTARFKANNMIRARRHIVDIEKFDEFIGDNLDVEAAALIRASMNLLKDEQAKLLKQRYISMHSASFLAKHEGISEQALNKRLRKCRDEFKKIFECYCSMI